MGSSPLSPLGCRSVTSGEEGEVQTDPGTLNTLRHLTDHPLAIPARALSACRHVELLSARHRRRYDA
jgi:hypothetical protein